MASTLSNNNVVLTSNIDGIHYLGARVSHEKPQDKYARFSVPFNNEKGQECGYMKLFDLQSYTLDDLQSQNTNFITGDRLNEKERQEVEGMLWYIFLDSDCHFVSRVRHMKKYLTADGRTVVAVSCREFNHTTGRPIVLILGETPMIPRQMDESSLVVNKYNRGGELTADEEDLVFGILERLVEGLPDYELKPIPIFGSAANPRRLRKRLSNVTKAPPPALCHCPPVSTPEDEVAGRILTDFLAHRALGCNGDCPRCSRLISIVRQTVGCRSISCTNKTLLVQDYVQHTCPNFRDEICAIPFCEDSRHLIWENREKPGPWIINDVIENITRSIIYPCQPLVMSL